MDGLEAARREIESMGGSAIAVPTDVADSDAVERAAQKIESEFGPIDIWINFTSAYAEQPGDAPVGSCLRRIGGCRTGGNGWRISVNSDYGQSAYFLAKLAAVWGNARRDEATALSGMSRRRSRAHS